MSYSFKTVPVYGMVPPGINGYDNYRPAYADLSQQERNERAQKLFAEAGYSKDKPLHVELLYNTDVNRKIGRASCRERV